ncbi:MAG: cytochrome c-type biogenesis protein CcmH [Gammaproteobacteria bacterium]|nr:cytochrome c-type biogenesis protein CcmH [Gammaproteobacteria bacterium]
MRLLLIFLIFLPGVSVSAIEAYEFKDEQMEQDYKQLIGELRCLVCQNQNLAGSDAGLAQDLRRQTHQMLMQGNNPDQVVEYMVERYGDFVLYRPQFKTSTMLLWLGPFLLAILVLWLLIRRLRSQQEIAQPDASSMQRARDLLANKRENS